MRPFLFSATGPKAARTSGFPGLGRRTGRSGRDVPRRSTGHPVLRALARLSFTARQRAQCWEQIGEQMKATHLPLEYCFKTLTRQAREDKDLLALVFADITARLNEGHSIGRAIAPYASPEEVMLIDAGQTAGEAALAQGFLKAALLMHKRREIRELIVRQLAYPCVLVLALTGFLVLIATVIVPMLSSFSNPATWRGPGAILYHLATLVTSWQGLGLALGFLGLFLAALASLPRWTGRVREICDNVPPWSLYRLLTGISWLYATATLLQTRGMKLGIIVRRLLATPETSRYLRWRLVPICRADNQGFTLGEALWRSRGHWPDRALARELRAYAALPTFNTLLPALTDKLLKDTMRRVERSTKLINAASFAAIIGLLMLFVAGIFSIQEQLTRTVSAVGGL